MSDLSHVEIIARLFLAAVLGSLVGIERERLDWAPGLRTHMLVCLGASLFMIVSTYGFMAVLGRPAIVLDPSRVAAQVVTGIGFLGAGTILLRQQVVRGLTTAASLWTVAAVGMAVGGGLYREAVVTTLLILLILAGIKPIERRFFENRRARALAIVVDPRKCSLAALEEAISAEGLAVLQIVVRPQESDERNRLEISIGKAPRAKVLALVDRLRALPGIDEIELSTTHGSSG
jgi:putative Mg2+ transporter-C (MgtC) family protein